jgi:hypothetical protein
MARFGEHAVWFAFTSNRFDHSSDLPPEANAGNRFYGRDVASFIAAGLSERGLEASFFDEDWGWQAHAKRPDESVLEISIYHNPDEDQKTEVDDDAVSTLEDVFREAGVALRRTSPH